MTTLDELITPLTREQIEAAIYEAVETFGVSTSSWKSGGVTRTIISATAIALAGFSTLQAQIARLGFLDLSEGVWLEIVARQVYGVEKSLGTFATGTVELTNTGGGVFSVEAGDLVVTNSATGASYRNIEAFTLAPLEANKPVSVSAIERGTGSNAAAGQIDTIETTLLGVSVTNPSALIAQDEDSDILVRQRSRGKIAALSPNGPADAYRFAAISATQTDGTPAGVTRVATVAHGDGRVTVIAGTASGDLSGSLGDPSTPLGAVEAAIHTLVEPLSVTASVTPSTPRPIDIQYTAYMRAGSRTPNEVRDEINARLETVLGAQPIGGSKIQPGNGFMFVSLIEAVIKEVIGTRDFIDLSMPQPAENTPISADQAPVAGSVIGNVVTVLA